MKVFAAKAWLAGAGLVVGITGMALEVRGLIWVGVALLGAAFALRFIRR